TKTLPPLLRLGTADGGTCGLIILPCIALVNAFRWGAGVHTVILRLLPLAPKKHATVSSLRGSEATEAISL
ncbi:MAG: hypothetical protein C4532_01815, partial [Candidatus Abyssobacteria bacterium SURF_17]